jgi:Trypsin
MGFISCCKTFVWKLVKLYLQNFIVLQQHCTAGRAQNGFRVIVGTHLLNSGGVAHQSQRYVNHPSYNPQTIANDVSVIQTASVITFNALAQAMGLGSAFVGGGVSCIMLYSSVNI